MLEASRYRFSRLNRLYRALLPSFFAAFSKLWGVLADRFGDDKLFILLGRFSLALTLIPPLFEPCFETVFISGVRAL